jgi:hypothetical protein
MDWKKSSSLNNLTKKKCFLPRSMNAKHWNDTYNNNNNQASYSQASWSRLEMKSHEQKKQVQNKSEKEGENKGR